MREPETPVLDAITVTNWIDASEREVWEEYERRKQHIKKSSQNRLEYERRIAELLRELEL